MVGLLRHKKPLENLTWSQLETNFSTQKVETMNASQALSICFSTSCRLWDIYVKFNSCQSKLFCSVLSEWIEKLFGQHRRALTLFPSHLHTLWWCTAVWEISLNSLMLTHLSSRALSVPLESMHPGMYSRCFKLFIISPHFQDLSHQGRWWQVMTSSLICGKVNIW